MGSNDHEAGVRRTISRYAHCYDDGDVDGWLDTFTKDAKFVAFGAVQEGRDAIAAAIPPSPDHAPAQHMTYNTVVEVDADGENARAWSDFVYLQRQGDVLVPAHAGRYYDRLVREGDTWRFTERSIRMLGNPAPAGW